MKIEDEIKSSFRNDYHKLLVNIQLTAARLGDAFNGRLKEFDISATQFNVLRILRGQKQQPASIGLIKERMLEKNSDVSRIIDRLLKKELIQRSECPNDRRQKDVIISQKGLDLLSLLDRHDQDIDQRFEKVSEEDVRRLNDLLDMVRTEFTKTDI